MPYGAIMVPLINSLWNWVNIVSSNSCCLAAISHYLNQCWLISNWFQWQSSQFPKRYLRHRSLHSSWKLLNWNSIQISQGHWVQQLMIYMWHYLIISIECLINFFSRLCNRVWLLEAIIACAVESGILLLNDILASLDKWNLTRQCVCMFSLEVQ